MTSKRLSFDEYRSRSHISVLDGLRAVSILLVITYHPVYRGVWPIFHGGTGVSIFFVLSGYLITFLAIREELRFGRLNLASFYIRRFFRIYPLFLATLLLYVVLIYLLHQQPDRRDLFTENLPYYLLFTGEHSLFFNHASLSVPFDGTWSLGIEEKFYFAWPVIGFVVFRLQARSRVIFLSFVTLLAAIAGWIGGGWGAALAPYGLLAIGCILAIVLSSERGYRTVATLGRPLWLVVVTGFFVAVQFSTAWILPERPLYVVFGLLIVLVVGGLVTASPNTVRCLTVRPMVFLGKISYGLYLFHNFGLNLAEQLIRQTSFGMSLISTTSGVLASVVGVWVLHKFVEVPFNRLGHRLAARFKSKVQLAKPAVTVDTANSP